MFELAKTETLNALILGADISYGYQYGSGVIHFSRFGCSGTEHNLTICSHAVPPSYCSHSSDAGVVCRGKTTNCFDFEG